MNLPMKAFPLGERELRRFPYCLVQPKLDGVRAVAMADGTLTLPRSGKKVVLRQEISDRIAGVLSTLGLDAVAIDGEIWAPRLEAAQVAGLLHRVDADLSGLQFSAFDVISGDVQAKRVEMLEMLAVRGLNTVPTYHAEADPDKLVKLLRKFVEVGYEGIIVRHPEGLYKFGRSKDMLKFKPSKMDVYRIVGFEEEHTIHGEPKGTLGALLCISDDSQVFGVGTGFTAEQRKLLWEMRYELIGKKCVVRYQSLTHSREVPRFPVYGGLKIEN